MNTTPWHFFIYKDVKGEWRWRLRAAGNNKTVADSGEGYKNRVDCVAGIKLVRETGGATHVWDETSKKWTND